MAQHAQKGLLHGIFSVGGIAQDGERHAIERRGVLIDEGRERFFFRVLAGFVLHGAVGDLHPERNEGLAGAHTPTRRRLRANAQDGLGTGSPPGSYEHLQC